jgi:hypothetical protein
MDANGNGSTILNVITTKGADVVGKVEVTVKGGKLTARAIKA